MPFTLNTKSAKLTKIALVSGIVLLMAGCINPVKQQQNELVGKWRIVNINDQVIAENSTAKMVFTNEGSVNGNNGCNNFFGTFKPKGDHLNLSPLGTTRMLCTGDSNSVEQAFNKALDNVEHFLVKGDELFLTNEQDIAVISLVAESASESTSE